MHGETNIATRVFVRASTRAVRIEFANNNNNKNSSSSEML